MNSIDNNYVVQSETPCTLSRMHAEVVEHTFPVTGLIYLWDNDADVTLDNITGGHIHHRDTVNDIG